MIFLKLLNLLLFYFCASSFFSTFSQTHHLSLYWFPNKVNIYVISSPYLPLIILKFDSGTHSFAIFSLFCWHKLEIDEVTHPHCFTHTKCNLGSSWSTCCSVRRTEIFQIRNCCIHLIISTNNIDVFRILFIKLK